MVSVTSKIYKNKMDFLISVTYGKHKCLSYFIHTSNVIDPALRLRIPILTRHRQEKPDRECC